MSQVNPAFLYDCPMLYYRVNLGLSCQLSILFAPFIHQLSNYPYYLQNQENASKQPNLLIIISEI